MKTPQDILEFWFEGVDDTTPIKKKLNPFKKWFVKSKRFDEQIRENFLTTFEAAKNSQLNGWQSSVEGRMALILLFDQFTRNMFRGTPQMFASDEHALEIALRLIEDDQDLTLPLLQRVFLYLPLEHAEDLQTQELSILKYEGLVEDARRICPENVFYFEYNLTYAHQHHDIIKKFGRFPHRNIILERSSTAEETVFLEIPGSSF